MSEPAPEGSGGSQGRLDELKSLSINPGDVALGQSPDRVYWGGTWTGKPGEGPDGMRGRVDEYKTLEDAQREFYRWNPQQRKNWSDYLVKIGWLDEDEALDAGALKDAWDRAATLSSEMGKAGRKLTPQQAAAWYTGEDGANRTAAGRARTYTRRDSSVNVTTAEGARAVLNDAMARYLGRNATGEEVSAFLSKLNESERANPTVTSTTTTSDAKGENTSTSSTSTGGVDADEFARGQVTKLPEHAAYQAGVTYANALFDAIRSPV